jgi:Family of unknown function (DUF6055)
MTDRRRHLVGLVVTALALSASLSGVASASSPGLADAIPSLASPSQKPFIVPKPRPSDVRGRPTDDADPNRNSYTVPEAPKSPACSADFCVHWVAEGLDAPDLEDSNGNGVPDFVQKVIRTAEHVHEIENGKLGWREPKSDGRAGGGRGKTDIYLSQIGGELFGYASPDPDQGTRSHPLPRRLHGYLVLDNDYSPFEFPGTTPTDDLRVTLAHEYTHLLQFGYDAYQDLWFAESSATWMEDQVYDGIDDYLRYVRRWVHRYATPLTTGSIKAYGSAVWNQWLARRYGVPVVRRAWARAIHTRPGGFSVSAWGSAIRAAGGSDFSRDFARFATDVAEWRTGEGFRESAGFPNMSRQGHLALDGATQTRLLNHTTFQMLRVPARGRRAVVVRVTAPVGTAAGVALVGRIGSERGGRSVERLRYKRNGGNLTVRLANPGRFERVTAVVVNADATANGFSARLLDWRYLTDGMPFVIRSSLAG